MDTTKKGFSDKQFFKTNAKSNLIKTMMNNSALSQTDLADYLNCTISSLRNKFTRDSFSLYDFIIICHVCGYSLAICNGDVADDIYTEKECINFIVDKIRNNEDSLDTDDIYDILDEAEAAQECLENYECTFDFSPENILTDEECNRIKTIQQKKATDKYNRIINGLSNDEQLAILEILKNKQPANESHKS